MTPCPCGGVSVDTCCGPLLRSERQAATAEELMRSRYTAFVVDDTAYLWRTWHPRTRPDESSLGSNVTWTGLSIIATEDGRAEDSSGIVEFVARHDGGELRERSVFEKRGGRWMYVEPVHS